MDATKFDPNTLPFNNPKETRKVAIVTGGSNGLGWYTTLHLYIHGWTVYLAARNPTKSFQAIQDIKIEADTRKESLPSNAVFGEIIFHQLDLISLESTQQSLTSFAQRESQLDLLINNAGIMAVPLQITKDDLDIQIQTNHVSPFYFTINLIPLLEKSKEPRIVFVSSFGHNLTENPEDISKTYKGVPDILSGWTRYGNSKLANILSAKALAEKFPSILSVSLHPGVCIHTNLADHCNNVAYLGIVFKIFTNIISHFAGISTEQGSYNTLYTALSPELTPQKDNGKYYHPVGYVKEPSAAAKNPAKIQSTWEWTLTQLIDRKFITTKDAEALHEPLAKEDLSFWQTLSVKSESN